jgi:uncharacterized MAPEG superfamily protein
VNVPLACLPIAFVLVYLPKLPLSAAMAKQPEGYDNKSPRDQQAKLTGPGRRAHAAHLNGFESFAPFAVGVLACEITHARPGVAASLAVAHVVARAIYPILYIADQDKLRSVVWMIGFLATLGLLALPLAP